MPMATSRAPLVLEPAKAYGAMSIRARRNLVNVTYRSGRPPLHLPYLTELAVQHPERGFHFPAWNAWIARQPLALKIVDGPGLLLFGASGEVCVQPSVLGNLRILRTTTVLPAKALMAALPHMQMLERLTIEATDASRSPHPSAGPALRKINALIAQLPRLTYFSILGRLVMEEGSGIAGDCCVADKGPVFAHLERLTLVMPTITSRAGDYEFGHLRRIFPRLKYLELEFHLDNPNADSRTWRPKLVAKIAAGIKTMSSTLRALKLREADLGQSSDMATLGEIEAITLACPQLEYLNLFPPEAMSSGGGRMPQGGFAAIGRLTRLRQVSINAYTRAPSEFAAVFLAVMRLPRLEMIEFRLPDSPAHMPRLPEN